MTSREGAAQDGGGAELWALRRRRDREWERDRERDRAAGLEREPGGPWPPPLLLRAEASPLSRAGMPRGGPGPPPEPWRRRARRARR